MKIGWLLFVIALTAAAPSVARASDGSATGAAVVTASAVVEDEYGEVMTVEDPSFFRPASGLSLGGGAKGTKLKDLAVWKGAAEILVPLAKIARIDVIGDSNEPDLLVVRLTLAGGLKFEGKVERDLEIRGIVQYGEYRIRFERMKSVTMRARA